MRYLLSLFFFLTSVGAFSLATADTVYLKSGEKVEGNVFREGGINVYMISDTEVGLISRSIPQGDIEKIEYAQNPDETTNTGQTEEIVKRYREFQESFRAGNASFQKKDYYDAMQSYRRAQELNPKSPQLYYNLGVVYVNLGYSSKAKECFQNAARLSQLIPKPSEKEQEMIADIEKSLKSLQ